MLNFSLTHLKRETDNWDDDVSVADPWDDDLKAIGMHDNDTTKLKSISELLTNVATDADDVIR